MNITLVWNDALSRGDWQISNGRMTTGNLLQTAVLISLFTDRVAQPDYVPTDRSGDRRGWWHDTFEGVAIGSRLWQLRRKKIADRPALILEAKDIIAEALQWLIDNAIASAVNIAVSAPPAGVGSQGTLLRFGVEVVQPTAPPTLVSALWRAA